jgi:DNA-binding transcriptional LysR family regulator
VELHHLRCVVAIADHGSFTAAAAALHLTQPSLSYAIARLERELGARLFDRAPGRTRLTAAGKAFLGPARRALAEANGGKAAVEAVTGVLAGELRVATIRTAVVETGQRLADFHRRYPAVQLTVEDPAGDAEVVDLVRSGRCELGIMRESEVPEDLGRTAIGAEELVVLFPADRAPSSTAVTLGDLAAVPLIAPLRGTRIRSAHDALFSQHGIDPTIVAECSHLETFVELVRGGVGAVMTSSTRAATLPREGLAIRPLRPRLATALVAVWRPVATPAVSAFTAMLEEVFASRTAQRSKFSQ